MRVRALVKLTLSGSIIKTLPLQGIEPYTLDYKVQVLDCKCYT
jgi:hypothetical protein